MLIASQLVGFGISGGAYRANAVRFDGVNDHLARGAGLTGAVDAKVGVASFWFNFQGNDGTAQSIFSQAGDGGLWLHKTVGNNLGIRTTDTGLGVNWAFTTTATYTAALNNPGWHHFYASWDLAATTAKVYIDGATAPGATGTAPINSVVDYTRTDSYVCSRVVSAELANVRIADFYLNTTIYLDPAVAANLAKFINSAGKPVDLGLDGSLPTGTQPIVFLSKTASATADSWATNKSSGGGFTVVGALQNASDSPSD